MLTRAFHKGAPPTATSLSAASSSSACPKCGTAKKSGTRSCCARDGAWFKNCGDTGDTHFDHTWAEGIQACKVTSVTSPLQAITYHAGAIVYPLNSATLRNTTQQQRTNINRPDSISNVGSADSEDRVGRAKDSFCICVLFIISHLQT